MALLSKSFGVIVTTNNIWARAKPANRPWHIFERRIQDRWKAQDKLTASLSPENLRNDKPEVDN